MKLGEGCSPLCFNTCLKERTAGIDAAFLRGEIGSDRRSEQLSAAFFDLVEKHHGKKEGPVSSRPAGTGHWRERRTPHHRIEQIIGAEAFLVKRGREQFEIRLCSVRVPGRFHDQIAAALSELLLFERVEIRHCCFDGDGVRRGVVVKIDPDAALGGDTVNEAAISYGFGQQETGCRQCHPPVLVHPSTARRRRKQFLQYLQDRAGRRTDYILEP